MIASTSAELDAAYLAEPEIQKQIAGLPEAWARNLEEGPPWSLIAAMLRLGYGAGYSTGLQDRVDLEAQP